MTAPHTPSRRLLPEDAVLLPLQTGELLVSREQALFCRIPTEELETVRAAIRDGTREAELSPSLVEDLARHGFGLPPRPSAPVRPSVQLQLTNECNLKCAYCCTDSGQAREQEVSRYQLFRVVDEARATLGSHSRFGMLGGEPFMVPWAIELAEYIVELGSSLVIFSNGLRLGDPELLRRVSALVRKGVELRISLAGVTRESCDTLSGALRFDRAIEVVHALRAQSAHPFVDVMLTPDAIDLAASQLPKLRQRLPPDTEIHFGILYLGGRERGEHLFGSRRALESALDRITFEAGETIPGDLKRPITDRRDGCSCALGHHLHVRSDGALFGCFKMVECLGHLRQESFADVAKAAATRARPAHSLAFCRDCVLATLCGGGCRTENVELTGDPETPVCADWRLRVCAELLAEDRPYALEWPVRHLKAEARSRGIETPD